MKLLFIAPALALAAFVAPQAAMAQTTGEAPAIIVTGEQKKDWDRGNAREADGLKAMQEAEKDLVRFSADLVEAQNTRDRSAERANNAREAFERLRQEVAFASPEDAHKWAERIQDAAQDWERYTKRIDEAARDLDKAQDRQAKAQRKVNDAQEKIDEGRAMMAAAEQAVRRP